MNSSCILFFVKYPERGQVKRRLAAVLGESVATELYTHFVVDALTMMKTCGVSVVVCFHPPDAGKRVVAWLDDNYLYLPQRGADLGQRMKNSLIDAFERGFQQAVIVGSDIPDLPGDRITRAFEVLAARDAVVGPSGDGGYYLIGLKHDTFLPQAFEGIPWGTATVFDATVNCLRTYGRSLDVLPPWNDIDTIADLRDFFQRNRKTGFSSSHTISYLLKHAAVIR